MQTLLDKEQFEGAKVLADIGLQIAAARATLATLKSGEGAYIKEREQVVVARIAAVLESSKALLREVDQNQDTLGRYRNELAAWAADLATWAADLSAYHTGLQAFAAGLRTWASEAQKEVAADKKAVKVARGLVDADMAAVQQQRRLNAQERVRLKDERGTLARAIERLKNGRV